MDYWLTGAIVGVIIFLIALGILLLLQGWIMLDIEPKISIGLCFIFLGAAILQLFLGGSLVVGGLACLGFMAAVASAMIIGMFT